MYFKDSDPIVECVPNFSEGRDSAVIKAIADAIAGVPGVRLLHVDIGFDAHRTVMTFAGRPEEVLEAAFQAIKTAGSLIDMSKHHGIHPRMGATDVCPLVPLRNISMEEVVGLSHQLGERVGRELKIPVYMYEAAATNPHRVDLARIRKGEYESIAQKMTSEKWAPDYGPAIFHKRSGMTAVGARPILVAYNIHLGTRDVALAGRIAGQIRESGILVNGVRTPGRFIGLKAIGWWMESYQCAEVSTNITRIETAPIHEVFESVRALAGQQQVEVTGSEIIGLVPAELLVNAGLYYSSTTFHEEDINNLIQLSIKRLGLNTLSSFKSEEKIIESLLGLPLSIT